jgi:hypothetical protein
MVPGNIAANVMGANVTGGVGLHAADLLTDLKSGYLLGANPRQQLFAQLFGVLAGAVAIVPAFNLLVPDASVIGSRAVPRARPCRCGPACRGPSRTASAVCTPRRKTAALDRVRRGHACSRWLEKVVPKKYKQLCAVRLRPRDRLVIPGANAIAMFLGAASRRSSPPPDEKLAERTVVPVSSGLIAGESLMGILVAVLIAFGVLTK